MDNKFLSTKIKKGIAGIFRSNNSEAASTEAGKLIAPITGEMIPLADAEDEVFSSGALGEGVAFKPAVGEVYAPCSGEITTFFETGHAVGITSLDGAEVLIHVGMDTVELKGEGFTPIVKEGDKVEKGQLLLKFDIDLITNKGYKLGTPMVVTNGDEVSDLKPGAYGEVTAGEQVVLTYRK